jgi:hypothetical protein
LVPEVGRRQKAMAAAGKRAEATISAPVSSKDDVGRFLQALQAAETAEEDAFPAEFAKLETPRELRFERDILRLFDDAWWMQRTGDFPDGKPKRQQRPFQLRCWQTWIAAMERRQWGGEADEDEGGE